MLCSGLMVNRFLLLAAFISMLFGSLRKSFIQSCSISILYLISNLSSKCGSLSSPSVRKLHVFTKRSCVNNKFSPEMSDQYYLDKSQFDKEISLVALKVPTKLCSIYLQKFQNYCFQRPRCKRVYDIKNDPSHRLLLLSEQITTLDLQQSTLPQALIDFHLSSCHVRESVQSFSYQLTYEHYTTEEILSKLLFPLIKNDSPDINTDSLEIPCSFEQAGHIAHMNIREEMLPYKNIIGQVILHKNVHIKTVVNKIGQIETEFRTFPMEVCIN